MTRLIIRAMPERQEFIEYLMQHLPEAQWCMDQTRNAMDTFLAAMRMAGDDPCVHLEEDIVLAPAFRQRLEAQIAQRPSAVIQFFSMRKADLTVGSRWDTAYCMNQCFYLPAGYSRAIADYHPSWPRRLEHPTGSDYMINDFLKSRRERYWIHVPSLVDHRVCKSLIDSRRSSKRQSKTFCLEMR